MPVGELELEKLSMQGERQHSLRSYELVIKNLILKNTFLIFMLVKNIKLFKRLFFYE